MCARGTSHAERTAGSQCRRQVQGLPTAAWRCRQQVQGRAKAGSRCRLTGQRGLCTAQAPGVAHRSRVDHRAVPGAAGRFWVERKTGPDAATDPELRAGRDRGVAHRSRVERRAGSWCRRQIQGLCAGAGSVLPTDPGSSAGANSGADTGPGSSGGRSSAVGACPCCIAADRQADRPILAFEAAPHAKRPRREQTGTEQYPTYALAPGGPVAEGSELGASPAATWPIDARSRAINAGRRREASGACRIAPCTNGRALERSRTHVWRQLSPGRPTTVTGAR
jgi:hypothetical protein